MAAEPSRSAVSGGRETRMESFFVFIGGIQPRRVTLDPAPRRCPRCGHLTATLQRIDHYPVSYTHLTLPTIYSV